MTRGSRETTGPNVVIPTMTESNPRAAVERIAAFAAAARPEQLPNETRQLFKRNILDSLGCAIAGLQGRPFQTLREQFEEYRAPGRCTLIGGGKTSADQAALFNSGLVRYVDLLDSYMAPGGLCHPSDNFGTLLAAAEQAGASGEEFMLALAVAYEIQCRFSAAVPVMAKGFNHATQLAISAAASVGKVLGLSTVEIANAIAIATVDNVSLTCVHAEPVSQWKGFFTWDDRDACYLRCRAGQAWIRRSNRSVRNPRRAGANVRAADPCGLGGSLVRYRVPDGTEEILFAH